MSNVILKSAADIEKMKAAGKIVEDTLLAMEQMAKVGITTQELDAAAHELIISRGAKPSFLGYRGYPKSICTSVNEQVVHGIPGKYRLKSGDILSVDVGAMIGGWHGDAARTFFIGDVSDDVKRLVYVTQRCFFEGLKYAKVGYRLYDISAAIQDYAESNGYGVVRELTGHGIGRGLHEAPDVPNFLYDDHSGRGIRLEPGMTLAIEPMINMGTPSVRVLKDEWTVVAADAKPSAHYENTIAITDGEPLLLTLCEQAPEVEHYV